MLTERASGVLLHPTSLPSRYGIGSLGKPALEFIDFLVKAKQRYWQILPLGPTGYGDSPYQCFSAHAGNPNLIDLELLQKQGFLEQEDLEQFPNFGDGPVRYGEVQEARQPLLRKAFNNFSRFADSTTKLGYRNFVKEHGNWLNDFVLFMAIKSNRKQRPWLEWEPSLRAREPEALKAIQATLGEELEYQRFLQFIFFRQWMAVKEYAHRFRIRIIGDIPLYIALDSADAWANPGLFEFGSDLLPLRVGGVPPDYFSETGQLWGNPLFDWERLKDTDYRWWKERIRTSLLLYDVIRIDHFRGFAAYWAVPYGEETAINGSWITAPGQEFFEAMQKEFGKLPIIAEDLGVITPDVESLRDGFGFPGMKILEFAFDSSEANDYIPHNYVKNCIVYTGTHDNDTVIGWFQAAGSADRQQVLDYIGRDEHELHWSFIRLAWASVAYTAIVPMQDLLGLGNDARMNLPGTTTNNWVWRVRKAALTSDLAERLAHLTELYGRSRRVKTK